MKSSSYLILGISLAALSVGLGAFGAHGLKNIVDAAQLVTFETGVRYQFFHSFAIIIAFILQDRYHIGNRSSLFFLLGILFFSGSLYLLSLQEVFGFVSVKFIGPITPIGGVCFLVGWGLLAFDIFKSKNK